ncbi:hypothetical protein SLNSH_22500 [Alsobacter soli]|uniref:Uncharacterized protein n=1 Tax=Alsobacter soli TaxID=2109933 RepID=A0A2T1HM74_9HYPH|nr:hypothetical protein [Alsobacter soli]PSC02753.1 hypothetical protein SLNSH_22500 [Alsobacter soli]
MRRSGLLLAVTGMLCALAYSAAAEAAPKAKGGALKITVTNKRSVAITSLGFLPPGADTGGSNLLKKPLAPGKSIVLTVPAKKGECLFDILGSYEDELEISGSSMDVCKDHQLTLVD